MYTTVPDLGLCWRISRPGNEAVAVDDVSLRICGLVARRYLKTQRVAFDAIARRLFCRAHQKHPPPPLLISRVAAVRAPGVQGMLFCVSAETLVAEPSGSFRIANGVTSWKVGRSHNDAQRVQGSATRAPQYPPVHRTCGQQPHAPNIHRAFQRVMSDGGGETRYVCMYGVVCSTR